MQQKEEFWHCERKYIDCRTLGTNETHKLSYLDWRNKSDKEGSSYSTYILFCVHGLARLSHDFDEVAKGVIKKEIIEENGKTYYYRVISIDMPGRGNSDFIIPSENYNYTQYLFDVRTLAHQLKFTDIDYLGTSMGGLIGMFLTSTFTVPSTSPSTTFPSDFQAPHFHIRKFIINDVGPYVRAKFIARILPYMTSWDQIKFQTFDEAVSYYEKIYAPFKLNSDQLKEMTRYSFKKVKDEKNPENEYFVIHLDPKIGDPFKKMAENKDEIKDVEMWYVWEKIVCTDILLINGGESDLLTKEVVEKMKTLIKFKYEVIEGVGHAPCLVDDHQIKIVTDFLFNDKKTK